MAGVWTSGSVFGAATLGASFPTALRATTIPKPTPSSPTRASPSAHRRPAFSCRLVSNQNKKQIFHSSPTCASTHSVPKSQVVLPSVHPRQQLGRSHKREQSMQTALLTSALGAVHSGDNNNCTLGALNRRGAVRTTALGVGSAESEGTLGASGGALGGAGAQTGAGSDTGSGSESEGSGEGSPRRSIGVQFTCNKCQQQSTRYVNPLALTKGTIFLQCANAACNAIHQIVDNLNLVEEINYREEDEKRKREESEGNGTAAGA